MKIEEKIALYLNEGRSKEVDFQFAADFINKKCRKAATGTPIYRGNRKLDKDFYYINPKTSDDRVSPWADYNYYNLLLSNLPSWKEYPKRSKSIVCTTSYDEANGRNSLPYPYRVFPVDGADIGVCPAWDIWDSFQDALDGNDLSDFNYVLRQFLENTSELFEEPVELHGSDKNYPKFIRLTQKIDELDKSKLDFYDIDNRGWLDNWKTSNYPFLYYLNKLLSPKENGFKIVKSGAIITGGTKEVWTNSECIMVIDKKTLSILETEE